MMYVAPMPSGSFIFNKTIAPMPAPLPSERHHEVLALHFQSVRPRSTKYQRHTT